MHTETYTEIEHNGRVLKVTQQWIDVTSALPRANPAWTLTDAAGHQHAYGTPDDLYPTLELKRGDPAWCDDCNEEHTDLWYECRQCGDPISPGTHIDISPRHERGRWSATIDGQNVTEAEAEAFLAEAQAAADAARAAAAQRTAAAAPPILVYVVHRPCASAPAHPARLDYGTAVTDDAPALAIDMARRARVEHPHYTGPLTVSIWEARDRERYLGDIPEGAFVYGFPEDEPDDGDHRSQADDDYRRWIVQLPDDPDQTTVYVQPGGCVEIRQLPLLQQRADDPAEMVHLCDWDAVALVVADLRARRDAER